MNAALRTVGLVAVMCALCLVMSGCGGSGGLTKATFDSIKTDSSMTVADVDKLVGSKGQDLAGDAAKAFTKGFGEAGKKAADAAGDKGAGDAFKGMTDLMGNVMDAMMPKAVRYGDDNKYIVIIVVGGKVVGKDQKGL
jgi:hypothetical protein